jgi:hypothetical protein
MGSALQPAFFNTIDGWRTLRHWRILSVKTTPSSQLDERHDATDFDTTTPDKLSIS